MPEQYTLSPELADFYTTQSVFSDPGALANRYADLPADPRRLARVARDVMLHRLEGEHYGYAIPDDRMHNDAETRYVDDILRIVVARDQAPLTEPRAMEHRFIGTCRDFALLHCSLLRHVGVPARTRAGFADYFRTDGFHNDHVVTEYWDGSRGWLLADPELTDPHAIAQLPVDFDPMDVPRDRFLVAGAAWRAIREGEREAKMFGLDPESPLVGESFVAGSILLDLAALNRTETLLWDTWGTSTADPEEELTEASRTLCDEVARVTAPEGGNGKVGGGVDFAAARALFRDREELRVPPVVRCFAPFNGPSDVALRVGAVGV